MIKKIITRTVNDSLLDLGDDIHTVLKRVYSARGVASKKELDMSLSNLLSYESLSGIQAAVDIIIEAIFERKSILIVADFDCDGATSCAVAVRALRLLGAQTINYLVPNRFEYGYGLTPEIVDVAVSFNPDLLITVDNGIASVAGVSRAKELGMQVIITDHHLQGSELPNADAIVNPNQKGDEFKSKNLAGVGVIFYVLLAVRAKLRDVGWFEKNNMEIPNLAGLLDLVALGTVADIVPLDANNRILVEQGLRRIRGGHACAGIDALLEISKRRTDKVVASDMGFAIGPRLNAAGRLEDMSVGIECLLSDSPQHAKKLAIKLDSLNQERKAIENDMRDQAFLILDSIQKKTQEADVPVAICLYDESWHQGVIGILASRVKERFNRPVIIFAEGLDGEIKGSARSINGVHIRDVLDAIATQHKGLIKKFGGHAMAAGLSIEKNMFEQFTSAFKDEVTRWVNQDDLQGYIATDGELDSQYLSLELASLLRHSGPWGQGFPEPVFEGDFIVLQQRIVGERHLKMLLQTLDGAEQIDAIAFNAVDSLCPENNDKIKIVYNLDVNEFRGNTNLQFMVNYIEVYPR